MKAMQSSNDPPASLKLARGQVLLTAGSVGPLWRVMKGTFCLTRPGVGGQAFVQLALAGDTLGVECLCAEPYAFTAIALVDSEVCIQPVKAEMARYKIMAQGFLQQQRRSLDMNPLRSGSIAKRIEHLLRLLSRQADGQVAVLARDDLPSLSELALIVDSAPETVCRELKAFMPARRAHPPAPRAWRGASPLPAAS